jgi:hypothetical protein
MPAGTGLNTGAFMDVDAHRHIWDLLAEDDPIFRVSPC